MSRKIKFVDMKSEVPIVKYSLFDGTEGFAILDTGSEITSFDSNFVKEHKETFETHKTKFKINVVGLHNSADKTIIKASAQLMFHDELGIIFMPINDALLFSLDNVNENLKQQYHSDIKVSAILGSDFFAKHKIKIDFNEKMMIFNDDISGK